MQSIARLKTISQLCRVLVCAFTFSGNSIIYFHNKSRVYLLGCRSVLYTSFSAHSYKADKKHSWSLKIFYKTRLHQNEHIKTYQIKNVFVFYTFVLVLYSERRKKTVSRKQFFFNQEGFIRKLCNSPPLQFRKHNRI